MQTYRCLNKCTLSLVLKISLVTFPIFAHFNFSRLLKKLEKPLKMCLHEFL